MIGTLMAIVGLAGAAVIVTAYMLLEAEKIDPRSPRYYALNALGAVLILASIAADFDPGDLGGITVELLWMGISLMGLWKALRRRARAEKGVPAQG